MCKAQGHHLHTNLPTKAVILLPPKGTLYTRIEYPVVPYTAPGRQINDLPANFQSPTSSPDNTNAMPIDIQLSTLHSSRRTGVMRSQPRDDAITRPHAHGQQDEDSHMIQIKEKTTFVTFIMARSWRFFTAVDRLLPSSKLASLVSLSAILCLPDTSAKMESEMSNVCRSQEIHPPVENQDSVTHQHMSKAGLPHQKQLHASQQVLKAQSVPNLPESSEHNEVTRPPRHTNKTFIPPGLSGLPG
ncbi:hypothetical protein V8F06_010869 [Rhypophila decipiens]